jgi:hypothetical protein
MITVADDALTFQREKIEVWLVRKTAQVLHVTLSLALYDKWTEDRGR